MKYVYKIVCALLAVVVIGIVFFAPIIGIRIESVAANILASIAASNGNEEILEKIASNNGEIPEHISETTSLYDMAFGDTGTFFSGFATYFDIQDNKAIETLIAPVIAFIVSLGLTVICALMVIIFGVFAKNNRKVIYASVAGIGSYLMVQACFKVINDAFVSGRITLADVTQEWWVSLFGNVVNFDLLEPITFVPIAFAAVIIWTLLYNYTLTPEQKRERKLMLGEAD